jgi:hypothetical protein
MKHTILTLGILLTINLNAQQWFEADKQLHFVGGAGFGALGYTLGDSWSKGNRGTAIWAGIGTAAAVGTFKELWDIPTTGFDRDDLFTTIIGGVVSTLVTDLIVSRKPYKQRQKERLDAIKRRDKYRELHEIEKAERRTKRRNKQ